jgi:hypothetical protein
VKPAVSYLHRSMEQMKTVSSNWCFKKTPQVIDPHFRCQPQMRYLVNYKYKNSTPPEFHPSRFNKLIEWLARWRKLLTVTYYQFIVKDATQEQANRKMHRKICVCVYVCWASCPPSTWQCSHPRNSPNRII